jgi:Leucine-rich repeat (LRR) protein
VRSPERYGRNCNPSLPAGIVKLQNLTKLHLINNQLTTLPAEIGQLQQLGHLNLSKNPIPLAEQEKIRKLLPNCNIQF